MASQELLLETPYWSSYRNDLCGQRVSNVRSALRGSTLGDKSYRNDLSLSQSLSSVPRSLFTTTSSTACSLSLSLFDLNRLTSFTIMTITASLAPLIPIQSRAISGLFHYNGKVYFRKLSR